MTDREMRPPSGSAGSGGAAGDDEAPTFRDAVRFLYDRRVRLAARFVLFLALGAAGTAVWAWRNPPVADGRILLTFPGIERGEYPSGKKFSVEDFRGAEVLRAAAADSGLPADFDLARLSANLDIAPIMPAEVLARWKKQDRDGLRREEYVPTEFEIQIRLEPAHSSRAIRFFDALVNRYRGRAKFEQKAALRFTSEPSAFQYDRLLRDYDYWEIPLLFDQNVELLSAWLKQLVRDSREYRDPRSHYSFRALDDELAAWNAIRLESLKAMTFKGRLVKNRELALTTMQYRLEDLDVQIRQKSEEAAEAMHLLEVAQKPQPLLSAQPGGGSLLPVVDNALADRIMRSDFMPELIRRITDLQEKAKALQGTKWRVERDIAYLPQARAIRPEELPAGYRGLIETMTAELRAIVARYNDLLDSYLNDRIASLVTLREGPRLVRKPALLAVGVSVVAFAVLLSLLAVLLEHAIGNSLGRR